MSETDGTELMEGPIIGTEDGTALIEGLIVGTLDSCSFSRPRRNWFAWAPGAAAMTAKPMRFILARKSFMFLAMLFVETEDKDKGE